MNKIKELTEVKGIKGKELADMLGITPGQVSKLKSGVEKPSKRIEKLIDALFYEGRKPHPDAMIENVIKMMEECDAATKKNICHCAEKEKQLSDLLKEKKEREAA